MENNDLKKDKKVFIDNKNTYMNNYNNNQSISKINDSNNNVNSYINFANFNNFSNMNNNFSNNSNDNLTNINNNTSNNINNNLNLTNNMNNISGNMSNIPSKMNNIPNNLNNISSALKNMPNSINNITNSVNNIPTNMNNIPNNMNNIPTNMNNMHNNMNNISTSMSNMHNNLNNIPTNMKNIPTNMKNIPTNMKNIPTNMKNIPTNMNNIPTNMSNIPTNMNNIPTKMNNIPTNMNNIPTNMNNIPTNMNNIPTNMNNIPTNMNNISTNMNNIPTNMNNIPTNMNNIPTNMKNIPTNMKNIPTNMKNIPTNMNNIPTNMSNIPTNMSNIPTNMNNIPTKMNNIPTKMNNMPTNMNNMPTNMNNMPASMNNIPTSMNNIPTNMNNIHTNMNNIHNNMNNIHNNMHNNMNNISNSLNNIPSNMNNMHNNMNKISNNMNNMPNNRSNIPNNRNNIPNNRSNMNINISNNMNANIVNNSMNNNVSNNMNMKNNMNMNSDIANNLSIKKMMNNNSNLRENIMNNLNYNYNNMNYNLIKNNMDMGNKLNNDKKVNTDDSKNIMNNLSNKMIIKNNMNNNHFITSDASNMNRFYLNEMKNIENNMIPMNNKINNIKDNQSNIQHFRENEYLENIYKREKYLLNKNEKENLFISSKQLNNFNQENNKNNMLPRNVKNIDPSLYKSLNLNLVNSKNINQMYNFNNNEINNINIESMMDNKINMKSKNIDYSNMNINETDNIIFNEEMNYQPYNVNNNINNNSNNNNLTEKNFNNSKQFFMKQNNMFDVKAYKNLENLKEMKITNENKNIRFNNIMEMKPNQIISENPNLPTSIHKINEKKKLMNAKNNNLINMENCDIYKLSMNDKLNQKDAFNYMNQTDILKEISKENNKQRYISVKKITTNNSKPLKISDQQKSKILKINNMDNNPMNNKINNDNSTMYMNKTMMYEELKKNNTIPFDNMINNNIQFFNKNPMLGKNNNNNNINYNRTTNIINNYNQNYNIKSKSDLENLKGVEQEIEEKKKKKKREKKEEKNKEKKVETPKNEPKEVLEENFEGNKQNFDYNSVLFNYRENSQQNSFNNSGFNSININNTTNDNNNNNKSIGVSNLNINLGLAEENSMNKKQILLENYDQNNSNKIFLDNKNTMEVNDFYNMDDSVSRKLKKNNNQQNVSFNYTPEKVENDEKLMALNKLFGNVIDEKDQKSVNVTYVRGNMCDLDTLKNMSLDNILNSLNIDKNVLDILKDKINNISRNINVTICSTPTEKQIDIEKEKFKMSDLINCFDIFMNWCDNNLIQIKLQLYNIAFCLFLEIYILLLTNNYDNLNDFKNKYINKFFAYEPVTKMLENCVSLSQVFEISLIRFKQKNSKHIVHMTKLGKKSLFQYLNVYEGILLYNLITTKIKMIEVDDSDKYFNFFYAFVSANFFQNISLSFPIQWNLPSIYSIKDEVVEDENNKLVKETKENCYIPNESSDAYFYYKHILKTQASNRLKVTKNRIPSILYYCLNNCNDLTCAEISGFDGSFVATAHSNNIIKLWNIKQSQMNKLNNEKKDLEDNRIDDDEIRKYEDMKESKNIFTDLKEYENGISKLYGNIYNVSSLCFGETNKILLSGNINGDIYLYSTINNKNYVKYVGGNTPIWSIDTAFLGFFFCSGEDDGNLRIYSTNKTYPFITYKYNCSANICKYHYNNTLIGCGYYDNYVHLYDVRVNSFIKRFKNNYPSSQGVTSLAFSKNGRLLSYAGGYTNNINLIDLAMDKFIDVEMKETINSKEYNNECFNYIKSFDNYSDNNILKEKEKSQIQNNSNSYDDKILDIDFSYDNNLLVSMSCNNFIDFYNCSKVSEEIKSSVETKKIKLEKSKKVNNFPYVKLSKSYGVNYSNLISAKFTPENALLLFGINTLI
ncbi:conserved Plasmodium protein, unknown function [Plasmodium gallinaceum]|uniref:Uncharacterized protein n=1 Tax=Plasmodium gallinaceum TaxID=5849 RepID=A0A1J1GYR2_PLAGA|nr:conserved Plasmodium protein, unknown function [Plasmodium gallinaceum]CRG96440.1 conserved Plasmodium protein, unknown function [Plasmodium gallinaceum]